MRELIALGIGSGKIFRVRLSDGHVETLGDQAGPYPDGVVVESGVVYWTTMGTPRHDPSLGEGEASLDYSASSGGVFAVNLDGSGRRDVVPEGKITTGKQLASDRSGTLYWSDREGCRVSRVRVDGTGLTDLVVNVRDDDWSQECVGIAVDPGHVYWTQKGPAKGGKGRIFRAGIEIPPGETAKNRSDIEVLWEKLPEPIDLHIEGDWLYWTDRGAAPDGNTLNRAKLPGAGKPGDEPEILADGFDEAIGLAVDEATGVAYVSDLGGNISVVPLPERTSGEQARVLVTLPDAVSGIAGI